MIKAIKNALFVNKQDNEPETEHKTMSTRDPEYQSMEDYSEDAYNRQMREKELKESLTVVDGGYNIEMSEGREKQIIVEDGEITHVNIVDRESGELLDSLSDKELEQKNEIILDEIKQEHIDRQKSEQELYYKQELSDAMEIDHIENLYERREQENEEAQERWEKRRDAAKAKEHTL